MDTEVKIDKRTKAYKDRVKLEGESMPSAEPSITGISPERPPEITQRSEKPDFSKSADNPGFKLCMNCGCVLEFNDDGSPKRRVQPELCNACVWRRRNK